MYRVFVFPSCNEPGLEIIRALSKSNKIALFGGSSNNIDYDPSRLLLKNHVICPMHDEVDFDERFRAILEHHQIDLVFPAWDPLVAQFSTWNLEGTRFVTPNAESASLLLSKRALYERLEGIVPIPKVFDNSQVSLPAFAKPDQGSGSRDTYFLNTELDWKLAVERDLLICEYLPGDEYTVDCVNDLSGALLYAGVRRRARIGGGIALSSCGIEDDRMQDLCRRITDTVRIEGPWFAQFKMSASGTPTLMEVNARIAGSMGFTRLSGVNIPLISVFMFMGETVRLPKNNPTMLVSRYLQSHVEPPSFDWVIWDLDDTLVRKDGKPDPEAIACLYDCHNRGKRQVLLSKNPALLEAVSVAHLPDIFEFVHQSADKLVDLPEILEQHGIAPKDCILVNDSYTENFIIQERWPDLKIVTPDALAALGRETLE